MWIWISIKAFGLCYEKTQILTFRPKKNLKTSLIKFRYTLTIILASKIIQKFQFEDNDRR